MTTSTSLVTVGLALLAVAPPQQLGSVGEDPPAPAATTAGVPRPIPEAMRETAVVAVVVRSWSAGSATAWAELDTEWPLYGATPLVVDSTSLAGVASFDYDMLVSSDADVVILSDPAGGNEQYTPQEVDALRRYAGEGHGLLGTFKTFFHGRTDNTALAPLFGLRGAALYDTTAVSNRFRILETGPLFTGLGQAGWTSSGYAWSQVPDGVPNWLGIDLHGARIVAEANGHAAVVTLYEAPAYTAVYVSNMPEYFGTAPDKQLLYNAITLVASERAGQARSSRGSPPRAQRSPR